MVLKNCTKGKLFLPGEKEPQPIQIVVSSDGNILIYFHKYNGDKTKVNARVDFHDRIEGVVITDSALLIAQNPKYPAYMSELWVADCKVKKVKKTIQRHMDVRANVKFDAFFTSESRGGFVGEVSNISAGGLYVVSPAVLKIGERFSFRRDFGQGEMKYNVQVLWATKEAGENFGYGCRFVGLSSAVETGIRGFVFEQLRKMKQREDQKRTRHRDLNL